MAALRIGVNCGRLRSAAPLARALAVLDVVALDVPAAPRCLALVREALDATPRGRTAHLRVFARVGYADGEDAPPTALALPGGGRHCLVDAEWIAREADRCAAALGAPLAAVLLHNPEEVPEERRAGAVAAAAAALADRGATVGVSSADPEALDWGALRSAGVSTLRLPAHALDGAGARHTQATAARAFDEVLAYGPFRAVVDGGGSGSPFGRRLASPPVGFALDAEEYVAASEAVLTHFDAAAAADDDTASGCAFLAQLVADLNASLPKFASFEQWEHEIATQLVPMLHAKFEALDGDSADVLQAFFEAYGRAVRATSDDKTRALAAAAPSPPRDGERLEDWALRDLAARSPPFAFVSVGLAEDGDADKLGATLDAARRVSGP